MLLQAIADLCLNDCLPVLELGLSIVSFKLSLIFLKIGLFLMIELIFSGQTP